MWIAFLFKKQQLSDTQRVLLKTKVLAGDQQLLSTLSDFEFFNNEVDFIISLQALGSGTKRTVGYGDRPTLAKIDVFAFPTSNPNSGASNNLGLLQYPTIISLERQ